jgi:AcrR family transcriptional regulator
VPETAPTVRRGRPPSGGRAAILRAALDLLRERGASRLTTREVALRAGVSEGSVFYHFTDRSGLLTAVIADGLSALTALQAGAFNDAELSVALANFAGLVEGFLDTALTAMIAAQSDAELRAALIAYLASNDMGPHRGIQILGAYLRGAQKAGTIRADVDPDALAYLALGSSFLRVGGAQLLGDAYSVHFPDRETVLTTLNALLTPAGPAPADPPGPAAHRGS